MSAFASKPHIQQGLAFPDPGVFPHRAATATRGNAKIAWKSIAYLTHLMIAAPASQPAKLTNASSGPFES
jgi:hypothetical protein